MKSFLLGIIFLISTNSFASENTLFEWRNVGFDYCNENHSRYNAECVNAFVQGIRIAKSSKLTKRTDIYSQCNKAYELNISIHNKDGNEIKIDLEGSINLISMKRESCFAGVDAKFSNNL